MISYKLRIGSVRLLSKVKNCFPFLVNAFTSAPAEMKIRSFGEPGTPSMEWTHTLMLWIHS